MNNHLAKRLRLLYIGVPLFTMGLALIIGVYFSSIIADDFSRRLARQYSIEAAANFLSSTNSHFVLAQQLAYSTTISRWMADEYNEDFRTRAIEEIMGYAEFAPYISLMFTVYHTRNVYDLRPGFDEDDFYVWWQIGQGGDGALWFTNTRDAQLPFNLNIQRTRPVDGQWEMGIWTNHRMYYEGVFIGVVTAGSPFSLIFDSVFGGYDFRTHRGYIIDYNGLVRADSAEILTIHIDGLSAPSYMPEAQENPALAQAIAAHLQTKIGGAFRLGGETDAIALYGDFRYASIAPIIGTNWSVVVLSSDEIIIFAEHMPAIITAVVLVIAVLLIGELLIQKTALQPIEAAIEKEQRAIKTQELMYNALSIPSTLWDINGNLIDCNEAMVEFFGLSSKQEAIERYYEYTAEYQACGNRTEDLCHGELDVLFATGQGVRKRWLHKIDGEIVPVEVTMTRIPSGDTFVCVCYAVDLRPIEAAMAKEREAHEQAQIMLDLAPVSITLFDKSLNAITCNASGLKMFGAADLLAYEAMGTTMPPIQPDGRDSMQIFKEGTDEAMRIGHFTAEIMCQKQNGTPMPTEITWASVKLNGEDVIVEYAVDLTIRKEAEARANEAAELSSLYLNSAPVLIELWDENHNVMDCNSQVLGLFGLANVNEYARAFYRLSPEFQPCGTLSTQKSEELLTKAFKEGFARSEWVHKLSNGELFYADSHFVRLNRQGKDIVVVYSHDLTQLKIAIENQRKAHEKTQQILDLSPTMINEWSRDLKMIKTNKRSVEWYRVANEQEYIDRFARLAPPYQPCGTPTDQLAVQLVKEAFDKGSVAFEWITETADGEYLPIWVKLVRSSDDEDAIVYAYTSDLREIKQLEAQLREKEVDERTKLILDASPICITCYNPQRVMIDCNDEAVALFGLDTKEEFLDGFTKNFANFFPSHQPCGTPTMEKVHALFDEVEKSKRIQFEFDQLTKSGEYLPTEVSLVRVDYGDTFMFISYLRDLRQAKAAEEKEQENRDYIAALFQASPMFIDVWDEDLNLIDCNDMVCDLLGVATKEEFLNNLTEKYNPLRQPCGTLSTEFYAEKFEIALKEGYVKYNWVHLDVNGNDVPLEVTYVRIYRKGKALLVGYNYDMRDIKKAEAERHRIEIAEESNRAKSAFLARMSHEIRTPITAVMGISEIEMQNPHISDQTEDSFAKIHNSANSLLGIVNDILDLSKIEVGKMEFTHDEYDVASLVVDTANIHIGFANNKNINYNVSVDENLPTKLIGDALRISQIINNILTNAFKYTVEGLVDLSFSCEKDADDENIMNLIVVVQDTGLGMTPEQLEDLDNEYTRYHEENYRYIKGTGLGMPIVFNLVKLMDAKIDISSNVGTGTRVVVTIPQKIVDHSILGKANAQNLEQFKEVSVIRRLPFVPEPMPYGSVLVVDDVDANLYVAKGLLSFYYLNIETCNNGFDAIDKIKQGRVYDLIFMDYMMPDLNGIETMHKMREMGYNHPIVALTANAMIGIAEEFMRAGFDGFIPKPIQTKQLNSVLLKFIKNKQPAEVLEAANAERVARPALRGDINTFQKDPELLAKLREDFAKKHSNTFKELSDLINADDIETAHRLTHTIKGIAGMLYEDGLAIAARDMEQILAAKIKPTAAQLAALENQLNRVLDDIGYIQAPFAIDMEYAEPDEAADLLKTTAPLLQSRNVACLQMLDEIRRIPKSERLCALIEDFEFAAALEELEKLKTGLLK